MITDVLLISEARIATVQLLEQVLEHLRESTGLRGRSRLLEELRPEDISDDTYPLLVRSIDPDAGDLTRMFRRNGVGYGFYLDDNFWLLDPSTAIGRHYTAPPQVRRLDRIVREAETVVAATPLLADYLRDRTARVVQLDSFFDFSLVPQLPPAPAGHARVRGGFAASMDRVHDLRTIIAEVIAALDEHDQLEFEFIGVDDAQLEAHPRIRTFPYRHSYADYIAFQTSRAWDFGLAPLGEAASNLYKTDNKFREYAAQGIPGIYQDAPPYASVRDGVTGLLAGSTRTWRKAIHRYATEPRLRAAVRIEARADAERRSSLPAVAPQWQAFFASVTPTMTAQRATRIRRAIRRRSTPVARAGRRARALSRYGREQIAENGVLSTGRRAARYLWKRVGGR